MVVIINLNKIRHIISLISSGFRKYKKRLILITILGFLSGFFASIGIGSIIPLFFLVTGQTPDEISFITKIVSTVFQFLHLPFTPLFLILFMAFLFILKGIIQFAAKYINDRVAAEFGEETRNELLEKTFHASWPSLLNQKIGRLETIILHDVQASSSLFIIISSLILLFTSFVTYASVAVAISLQYTVLTIVLGGLLLLIFKPISHKIRRLSEITANAQKTSSHHISEHIIGMKVVKSAAVEGSAIAIGTDLFKKIREVRIKVSIYKQASIAFIEPGVFILIGLLFYISYKAPGFNIAAFAVAIYLIQKMFSFVQAMQTHIHEIYESIPFFQSVLEYRQSARKSLEADPGTEPFHFRESLAFDRVSFSYNTLKTTISDLNFAIGKGEIIGLIGPSGAGKTTIVDLLLRLFTPQAGAILTDGQDIRSISLKSWRGHIGYVPQDIFLINDTVKNNITFYKGSVTEAEIIESAKMANIYDTIKELPQGFETLVGERGIKLSGGQKQRIVLARALARKPDILILDEATSAIDAESEKLIQESITALRGRMTILIIAHRPSTVMNCNRLIVLDKGRIVEEGTPAELLKNPNSYFCKMK